MQVKVINKNFEDLYLSLIEDNPVIVIRIEDYKRLEQKYGVADFAFQAPIHYETPEELAHELGDLSAFYDATARWPSMILYLKGKCINKNNSEAFVKAVEKVFQVHGIDNVEYVVGASDAEQIEEGLTIIMFNPVEYCDNKSVKQLLKLIDSLRDEHEIQTWLENKQFIRMLFERYIPKKMYEVNPRLYKEILREDEELKYIFGIPKTDKSLLEFEKEILETSARCNSVKVKELVSFLLALDNEEDLKALLLCTMNEILDMLLKVEAKDNIFQDFEW